MTSDGFLSRLSAGLDRDEQLARAAAEAAEVENGDWFAGETDHHGIGVFESEEAARRIDYYATAETEHMTEQSPARTLRELPLKRLILERHTPIETLDSAKACASCSFLPSPHVGDLPDYVAWPCDYIQALASIYADPAETGGES